MVTEPGVLTSVYLPMKSFDRGSRMGFKCSNCQLDTSSINEIDIYVLFQEGPFEVKVRSITAVKEAVTFSSPIISFSSSNDIQNLLESTVRSGSSLYNIGYAELCIAIYQSTLNTLIGSNITIENEDLSDSVASIIKGMACEGIRRADTESKLDAAFI